MISAPFFRHISNELRTDRLLLRCPRAGDGELVHQAVEETLEQLRAWPASLPWAMLAPSVAASETHCQESAAAFIKRTALVFLAFDRSGVLIGSMSLHSINWAVSKFEIGFWCRASRQRQGLTTEGVTALVRWAFEALGANRVEALVDEENAASRSVCQLVGLQMEGVRQSVGTTPTGAFRNTCIYAALRGAA